MAKSPPSQPMYQHFVPQFLLKNFAHPYKPEGSGTEGSKGKGKRKYEKGMFPKDPVVRNLDLRADPPTICEKPIKRILGQMNMYSDDSKPTHQQQHVEKMLSKLETQASIVFQKIVKAFERKEDGLWITRDERDLVRKFLFMMKYRGSGFHNRFGHNKAEDYDENDRELMLDYMTKKGFKRPLDVWFHNIKTIIELKMDFEGKWIEELRHLMFPPDAIWFITHVEFSFMAICTPSKIKDEFILTDNCYGVFEGPNRYVMDKDTGEIGGSGHTPLHEFAPVSPKLMIVLRSSILPNPLEDANEDVRKWRALQKFMALDGVYPDKVKSLLEDLPVAKAHNNYTEIVNGEIRLLTGEDGRRRRDHKFFFRFFPVGTKHVDLINAFLLDNIVPCTSVMFESIESFSRTLESYLTAPCTIGKHVTGDRMEQREADLKTLERISRSLGSQKETVWVKYKPPLVHNYKDFHQKHVDRGRAFQRMLDNMEEGKESMEGVSWEDLQWPGLPMFVDPTYNQNPKEMFIADLEHAYRMWRLRVKIDFWSKGVDEAIRQRNRDLLTEAYLRLPPVQVWLYIKIARFIMLSLDIDQLFVDGPEEVIGRVGNIIKPEKLTELMYKSALNDIKFRKHPDVDIWGEISFDAFGAEILMLLRNCAFEEPGYIRDCGIEDVEQLARAAQLEILRGGMHTRSRLGSKFCDEGQRVELLTRVLVRERFTEALRGKVDQFSLEKLKKVLFETTYPTPPPTWRY
ncbi:hypothetical protein B0H63DRAFT_519366 [Podospora didyma]|uniref:DUF4238 domain-containing protein n=1 Tax=Podospora didyma TaxID=330526 RepID=A0AAE0NYP7_9PEZI|nr:hypothetical protein B0H63DRAFT_519366 [Podospora didyma]